MKYLTVLIAILSVSFAVRADEQVTLDFSELTVLNGVQNGPQSTVPMSFDSPNEILSISVDWNGQGDEPPFPTVFGFEGDIVLQGIEVDPFCNILIQAGATSYTATDCQALNMPYVSKVEYQGEWGEAMMGFGGSQPIDIQSTFTQATITPEPDSLSLLAIGLVVCLWRSRELHRR